MKRASVILFAVLVFVVAPVAVSASPYTVITYNLGLLRVFGSDFVPAVDARTKAAPAALARLVTDARPQIMLLEEVWEDTAADAITRELTPLGYAAVHPTDHTIIGLSTGLLLFVGQPLKVLDWKFTPFAHTTFTDGFVRKGVLQVGLEDTSSGARFALVGTHTVAVDTNNGAPTDKGQIDAIMRQADQVRAVVTERASGGSFPVLLLGDFNVGPGYADAAYRRFASVSGIRETGESLFPGAPLVTWDPGNPLVKYGNYPNEPAAKIDHVFLLDGGILRWFPSAARVLMTDPVPGLAFVPKGAAAPVPSPLSDHYAFEAVVELAASQP